jgi:hypothetical protein
MGKMLKPDIGGNSPEGKMSETERECAANYRQPPLNTRFKNGQSGNPRGRPVKVVQSPPLG